MAKVNKGNPLYCIIAGGGFFYLRGFGGFSQICTDWLVERKKI